MLAPQAAEMEKRESEALATIKCRAGKTPAQFLAISDLGPRVFSLRLTFFLYKMRCAKD